MRQRSAVLTRRVRVCRLCELREAALNCPIACKALQPCLETGLPLSNTSLLAPPCMPSCPRILLEISSSDLVIHRCRVDAGQGIPRVEVDQETRAPGP
eukprot:2605383-Rhodomonas_salina.2